MTTGPVRADFADEAAREALKVYDRALAAVMEKVSRRLARGVTTPGWAEAKLAEVQALRSQVARIVAGLDSEEGPVIDEAIRAAYALGRNAGIGIGTNVRAVQALIDDVVGVVGGTHTRILRWADDVYRSVIERAVGQTASGVLTTREAAQRAMEEFAARGVDGFVDNAGRSWRLESYVEMAVRTGTTRAHIQGTLDRFEEHGVELVYVPPIPEDCPRCRPYDGAVLSRTGRTPGYETLGSAMAAGFLHPSCRHTVVAYQEGVTRVDPPIGSDDDYKVRQKQRYYERQVRAAKRAHQAAKEFGDTALTKKAAARVRAEQDRLRAFVKDNGRKRLSYREQIPPATPKAASLPPVTGRDAQLLAPVRWNYSMRAIVAGPANLDDRQYRLIRESLRDWVYAKRQNGAEPWMNGALRGTEPMEEQVARGIEGMDLALENSRLPAPIQVYRGYTDGRFVMPDDWQTRDMTGAEWINEAFTSVTVDRETGLVYAGSPETRGFVIQVVLPKGTKAVGVLDDVYGLDDEGEMVIGRGLRYRIIRDLGEVDGFRTFEVEVSEVER